MQIGLAYVIVTTILFLFPLDLPVTGSNMSRLPPLLVVLFDGHLLLRINTGSQRTDYCVVIRGVDGLKER